MDSIPVVNVLLFTDFRLFVASIGLYDEVVIYGYFRILCHESFVYWLFLRVS